MIDGIKIGSGTGWPCLLCARNETKIYVMKIKGVKDKIEEHNCKKCGTFYIDYVFFDEGKSSSKDLSLILSHHLLNRKTKNENCIYTLKKRKNTKDIKWINPQTLTSYWPKNTVERIEKTLVNMYLYFDLNGSGGLWLNQYLLERLSFASGDLSSDEELDGITRICEILEDDYYIKKKTYKDKSTEYALTLEGMKKAESILNGMEQRLPQVFVAIKFGPESKGRYEAIKAAIEECGYKALRIDEKQYNRLIVPEIKSEIEKSAFVIAELMEHRNNVYYEAGFAEGKGKEVIFTSHKNEHKADNFDIQQVNTVLYESEEELKKKLIERIRATAPTD